MDFEREDPKCKFSAPDAPTVRQQLEYYSLAGAAFGRDLLLRYWEGARALISNWECEILSDLNVDLDKVTDPQVVDVIVWAGTQVKRHMNNLERVSKN